jgi:hypothetical protein
MRNLITEKVRKEAGNLQKKSGKKDCKADGKSH